MPPPSGCCHCNQSFTALPAQLDKLPLLDAAAEVHTSGNHIRLQLLYPPGRKVIFSRGIHLLCRLMLCRLLLHCCRCCRLLLHCSRCCRLMLLLHARLSLTLCLLLRLLLLRVLLQPLADVLVALPVCFGAPAAKQAAYSVTRAPSANVSGVHAPRELYFAHPTCRTALNHPCHQAPRPLLTRASSSAARGSRRTAAA